MFAVVCMTACSDDGDKPEPKPTDGYYGYQYTAAVDMFDTGKKRIYHIYEATMLPFKWGNTFPIPTDEHTCVFTIELKEGMAFVENDAIEYTQDGKQVFIDMPATDESARILSPQGTVAAQITRISKSKVELVYNPDGFVKRTGNLLADLKIWSEGEPHMIWHNDKDDNLVWTWTFGHEKTEEVLDALEIPNRVPFQFHPGCFTDVHREHMQGTLHVD